MGSPFWTTRRGAAEHSPTSNFAWRSWNVSKERRLGRGLEALLGRSYPETQRAEQLTLHSPLEGAGADAAPANASSAGGGPLALEIRLIDGNPYQPRREFDEQE